MAPMDSVAYPPLKGAFPLNRLGLLGCAARCAGAIQGKEGRIQVLVGLTVVSNIRVIHEQAKRSSWMIEANVALVVKATLQVAPNSGVWKSANGSPPEQLQKGCWYFESL
jgi:hypothetical protein